jgi:hypothetical protein
MNVRSTRSMRIFALLLSPVALWYVLTPTVTVHYSKEASEELRAVWNTQHRIYRSGRGGLYPGEISTDYGHIFPDEDFFMEFYWWGKKTRNHCVNIIPRWPTTHIYLDVNGDIDRSKGHGGDVDRLKQCATDTAKP